MSELADFNEKISDLFRLRALQSHLSWDQQTKMPPEGASARGEMMAWLARKHHQSLTDEDLGRIISSLEKQHNIKNNSYNIVSDLIKNIDYDDKNNLYKRILCIFNIIKVNTNLRDNFYDELNDIKSNNIPSKIKFKIMDIFDI